MTQLDNTQYGNGNNCTIVTSAIEVTDKATATVRSTCIAVSPDRPIVAVASDHGAIFILDCSSMKLLHRVETTIQEVNDLRFSPDGKWLAIASSSCNAAIIDLAEHVGTVYYLGYVEWTSSCIAWSVDGSYIATGSETKSAAVWDIRSLHHPVRVFLHPSAVRRVAFTPDTRCLVTSTSNSMFLWNIEFSRLIVDPYHSSSELFRVSPSPNAPFALVSEDGGAGLIDLNDGQRVFGYNNHANEPQADSLDFTSAISFSPYGNQVLFAIGNILSVFYLPQSFANGASMANPPQRRVVVIPQLFAATFSTRGKYIATGTSGGILQLWDADTLESLVTITSQNSRIKALSFSGNDEYIVAHYSNGTCRVWDITEVNQMTAVRSRM